MAGARRVAGRKEAAMGMPRRFWQDMSSEEFAELDAARVIAVLPVGAIEQHGPHLPVATDACINQGVLARALEQMPDDLPEEYRHLSPTGAGRLAWMAQDLHPSGACGNATDADAARGRALVEHAA